MYYESDWVGINDTHRIYKWVVMQKSDFDKFAHEYETLHRASLGGGGEDPKFFAEYKMCEIHQMLSAHCRHGVHDESQPLVERALDFGCGVGTSLPWFRKYFGQAEWVGLDVSERSLAIARQRYPNEQLVLFDGERIPLAEASVDLAFAMCVFHHIPPGQHLQALKELHRVLRPGGRIFIFEHNPYNPLTVRIVNNCPFDADAVLVTSRTLSKLLSDAGFLQVGKFFRIFFPHILGAFRPLERWLGWCPLGGQYFVTGLRAP